jgi:flagellar assembly protein FliH
MADTPKPAKSRARVIPGEELTAVQAWEPPVMGGGSGVRAVTAQRVEEIQRQAYDEGFALGRQEALAETRARLAGILNSLAEPLTELDEAAMQELALAVQCVARQLIRRELRADPGEIVGVVRETVAALPLAARNIRLHLHPEDAQLVRAALSLGEGDQHRRIVDDPTQTRGGCRVLTDTSQIDASLETRLSAVIAKMLGGERGND